MKNLFSYNGPLPSPKPVFAEHLLINMDETTGKYFASIRDASGAEVTIELPVKQLENLQKSTAEAMAAIKK